MVMKRNLSVVLIAMALLAGCSRIGSRTDAQVASDVQNKINGDSNIPDKQLNINANNGVVTLTGTVVSDAARSAAANDAAQVEGVKTVVNNLEVAPASAANQNQPQEQASNNPPPPVREERRPSPSTRYRSSRSTSSKSASNNGGDTGLRTTVPSNSSTSSSYDSSQSSAPPAPTPVPIPQKVTVPAGTQLSVRLNDEVDSEKAQVGDVFHGSISAPVTVGEETVIPTTADVEGRVVEVKSAGRFAGQSVLTLELTKLTMNGRTYSLQTSQWTKSGNGRGKSTAAKVGGGAAVGAILGGIFGGGKGAAIGAAAGAGAGTGVSAATKGQQIILRPEAVIGFQLQGPITVTPSASRSAMNQ
jgi:BON domain-containing protein